MDTRNISLIPSSNDGKTVFLLQAGCHGAAVILYLKRMSKRFRRIGNHINIRMISKARRTLRGALLTVRADQAVRVTVTVAILAEQVNP